MNKKLLVTAVAASLTVPVAANAAEVYGRVNNGLQYFDIDAPDTAVDTDSTWDVVNVVSRFGLKGSSDLENGMTVSGRYEFATDTVVEGTGVRDTRLGWVDIAGDWGSVRIGNQWSAFFNAVGTYISPTFTLGFYLGSSAGTLPLRTSNTIKYSNTAGPVTFQIDSRINASVTDNIEKNIGIDRGEDFDGLGIGVSFAATDAVTLGFAIDSEFAGGVNPVTGAEQDDIDRIGVGGSFAWADSRVDFAWYSIDTGNNLGFAIPIPRDDDTVGVYYHGVWGMNKLSVGYLVSEAGENVDLTQLFIGFYHKMGGGFQTYVESAFVDADNTENFIAGDLTNIIVGARYDF